jgi:hypothetical protein
VFPKVVQAIIVSNQVIRPAAYAAAGFLFASLGLHVVYAVAAALATAASVNFILAVQSEPLEPTAQPPDEASTLP